MPDQINASGAPAIPGSAGSVPPVANSGGETTPGVDYEKQYKELETKLGQQGTELGQYREFIADITPLLTELNENPELVQAIVAKKLDPSFVKAALEGKLTVAEATAATAAHAEVEAQLGSAGYQSASPEDIAKLVDEKLASKLAELETRNDFKSFEQRTADFMSKTADFAEYADAIDEWTDAHPEISDIEVAYYAVKGKLSEASAIKAAEAAQAEEAKQLMLNAQGGGVHPTQIAAGSDVVDSLIANRRNPNIFG